MYSVEAKELWDLLLNDQLTDFNISVIDEDRSMVAHRVCEGGMLKYRCRSKM